MAVDPTWEVDLFVDGPVTLRSRFHTRKQKGFRPGNPFYSDVEISGIPSGGLRAMVTARAPNKQLAFEAAVVFFGRMLDVLAFKVDHPLYVSLTEQGPPRGSARHDNRRILVDQEIIDAFQEADDLAMTQRAFLRSLGWYRKGLYTEDPFDKFLAFWIAMEIVASKYHQFLPSIDQNQAKKGSISQTWECFKALWGGCEQWPNIPGDKRWIDETNEIRKNIVHGVSSVGVDEVIPVVSKLDMLQRVVRRFLQDWRIKLRYVDVEASSQSLRHSDEEAFPF